MKELSFREMTFNKGKLLATWEKDGAGTSTRTIRVPSWSKTMQTIIVNVFSGGEHGYTMSASHKNPKRNFEQDWWNALKKVRETLPEDWQTLDVENELEKKGWVLSSVKSVEVSY